MYKMQYLHFTYLLCIYNTWTISNIMNYVKKYLGSEVPEAVKPGLD